MTLAPPTSTDVEGAVTVRTVRDLAEIDSIRDLWRSLQTHPRADVGTYVDVLAREREFVRPHVLVLERAGHQIGLVAGSIVRDALPWRVGSLVLGRSRARVLRIGGGGVMGECSESVAQALTAELRSALARGEADAAYLHQLDSTAPLASSLQRVPWLARDRWARPVGGWMLDVPGTYDAFLQTRKTSVRRNLVRYSKVLERELGKDLAIVCHRRPEELERLFRDSESVARLTYHRRMGVGFGSDRSLREFYAHAAASGWLRCYVLYAAERPIAFWHGLLYARTFFTRDTGYDPAFSALRPGRYLLAKIIEEHCRTGEAERFDYGVMELDYKRQFGTVRYERSSIYVFAPRPRGVLLSTLRSVSGIADRTARGLLGGRARRWSRKLGGLGRRSAKASDDVPEPEPARR